MLHVFSKYLIGLLLICGFIACKNDKKSDLNTRSDSYKMNLKYAKGFEIEYFDDFVELKLKLPYPGATEHKTYKLFKSNATDKQKGISIPVKSLVVTSTTHIPALELLGYEEKLVGFPNTNYISSMKTQKLVELGVIQELGNEENLNTELLMDLKPDVLIGFTLNGNNDMYQTIEKFGIPVLINGDWVEESPLGRAEWIKFFGVLFNRDREADSIFKAVERSYKEAKSIAKKATIRPTVLSGGLYRDIWNLPAGDSFEAQFLKDANLKYLWAETKGRGSLSLSIESVFDKGKNADIWLSPSFYESLQSLEDASSLYAQFNAFTNQRVYSYINKKGKHGGIIYFEKAPSRPDLVLKDIIKIGHPDLLENYELTFFEKLQ